jgi:hypothetical protein
MTLLSFDVAVSNGTLKQQNHGEITSVCNTMLECESVAKGKLFDKNESLKIS